MKNGATGRLGRLFFNAVPLESFCPGSVVAKIRNTTDPGTLRAARHSRMTSGDERRSGFTLIELLVVVLIIGVLTGVALPRYQTAVDKARVVSAYTTLRAVQQQQELYYLANGRYAASWPELEMSVLPHCRVGANTVAYCDSGRLVLHAGPGKDYHLASLEMKFVEIQQFFAHNDSDGRSNWQRCGGPVSSRRECLCLSLGGINPSQNANGHIFWRIP